MNKFKLWELSIRINTDNLNTDIIESIKTMFPHKNAEIPIQPADETEYILNDPDYSQELMGLGKPEPLKYQFKGT